MSHAIIRISLYLLLLALGVVSCSSNDATKKRLVSEAEISWFIHANRDARILIGHEFLCDPKVPTATCFLPSEERSEMLVNGRYTVTNIGFDFLSACRANEHLLQTAYRREPQFVAIVAKIAVAPTWPAGPVELAVRAEFEATLNERLAQKLPLLKAIKATVFTVFPHISGNLTTLDDAALMIMSGAMLNVNEASYAALLVERLK